MNIDEFREKYGSTGKAFRLCVEEFIRRAPEFAGDKQLARLIGETMADLECALEALENPVWR